jgi:hypothetical protein
VPHQTSNIKHQKGSIMRTTLNVPDDIFFAAKDFAKRDQKLFGEVLSDFLRRGLQAFQQSTLRNTDAASEATDLDRRFHALGFRTMPSRGGIVTNELINRIRDEEGI